MKREKCLLFVSEVQGSLKKIDALVTNYKFMQAREELLMTTLDSVKDLNDALIEALTEADRDRKVRP